MATTSPISSQTLLPGWLTATRICLLVLFLQNLGIYWQHYAGLANFVRDFTGIYYPMTAFWISLVQQGLIPEWIPYPNMGFPFVLTMQSGIFYPPFWLFTLLDQIPFTLQAASSVQALHVLFGAYGCWLYARLQGLSPGSALFAAVAFQFFGGFYGNAMHPDIIRAFAFIPWLFWAVYIAPVQQRLSGRNLFLPLLLLLFITGAYQGNLVSQLFFLLVFCVASWAQCFYADGLSRQRVTILYAQLAGLGLLGIALASVYLLPTVFLKAYLVRDSGYLGHRFDWRFDFWNSLFLPVNIDDTIYSLKSMLSAFVTVPVFCLLFLITREYVQKNFLWLFTTLFAITMAAGSSFFVFPAMVDMFPFLGYSRFPSSDYRGLFCFGLIFLAAGILDEHLKGRAAKIFPLRFALCVGLLLFYCAVGGVVLWLSQLPEVTIAELVKQHELLASIFYPVLSLLVSSIIPVANTEWLLAAVLALVCFLALYCFRRQQSVMLSALVLLELFSGAWYLEQTADIWRAEEFANGYYKPVDIERRLPVVDVVKRSAMPRAACTNEGDLANSSWQGYLKGESICMTYDSPTVPRITVDADPVLDDYMRREWQSRSVSLHDLSTCDPHQVITKGKIESSVQQISYGMQNVVYRVNATKDFCFIENEMLFSGWSGSVEGSPLSIEPRSYCGALRSWCLPAGNYQFTERYRTPGLREGAMLSVFFLLVYMALCFGWFQLNRTVTK